MAAACLHAWQATQESRYREALEKTLAFWLNLRDESGACFFGAQNADAAACPDGRYYTWTVGEIEAALPDDKDGELAKAYFGISEEGGLAQAPFRHVLFEAQPLPRAAARAGLSATEAQARLPGIRARLLAQRDLRPAPAVERTLYVDANALMAAAFLEAGRALENPAYIAQGRATLQFLLQHAVPGAAPHAAAAHVIPRSGEKPGAPPLAQDEAALAYACAVAFEVTREQPFAVAAEDSLRRLDQNFWDARAGGYFDRAAPGPDEPGVPECLAWPLKPDHDTSEASSNGLAALAWRRMGIVTGRAEFSARATAVLNAFGAVLEKLGPSGAALSAAAEPPP